MISKLVNRFMERKETLEFVLSEQHPASYKDLVVLVVAMLTGDDSDYGEWPDPKRVHEINDGDYQGTLVYVIAATGYQPSTYWYTQVAYGSCSGCDTLSGIRDYDYESSTPTGPQIQQYMTLALHLVQHMKQMYDTEGE